MRQLAQLDVRLLRLAERLGHESGGALPLGLERPARQLQRDDRMDEALLGSVVKITNHPPPLLVGRRHDPRPRRGEFRARLEVRDRCGDEFGELPDPRLRVRRQRLGRPREGDHGAPQAFLDEDRRRDRGTDALCARVSRERAGRVCVVVDAGGAPRVKHERSDVAFHVLAFERQAGADREAGVRLTVVRDDGGGPVGLVADHCDAVDAQQPRHLLGDGGEDLRRRRLARDQRRDAP